VIYCCIISEVKTELEPVDVNDIIILAIRDTYRTKEVTSVDKR